MKKLLSSKSLSIILLLLWLIFIFTLSSAPTGVSDDQSGVFVIFLSNLFNVPADHALIVLVRKSAHLFEYFVLGTLSLNVLRAFRPRDWVHLWHFAVIFAALYAATDELHQTFVPGRSGELGDVLLDTLAALAGVIFCLLTKNVKSAIMKRKHN